MLLAIDTSAGTSVAVVDRGGRLLAEESRRRHPPPRRGDRHPDRAGAAPTRESRRTSSPASSRGWDPARSPGCGSGSPPRAPSPSASASRASGRVARRDRLRARAARARRHRCAPPRGRLVALRRPDARAAGAHRRPRARRRPTTSNLASGYGGLDRIDAATVSAGSPRPARRAAARRRPPLRARPSRSTCAPPTSRSRRRSGCPMTWELRRARVADLDAIMALEDAIFPTDAWSRELMARSSTGPHRPLPRRDRPTMAPSTATPGCWRRRERAGRHPDDRRRRRARGAAASAARSCSPSSTRRGGAGRPRCSSRCAPTTPARRRSTRRSGSREIAVRPRYYQPDGVDAVIMRLEITEPGGPSHEVTHDGPLVLGIETCCDETGIGIVRGTTLLANVIASSMEEHARYGGVVPEVAARAHLEALRRPSTPRSPRPASTLHDLDAIAVTAVPGSPAPSWSASAPRRPSPSRSACRSTPSTTSSATSAPTCCAPDGGETPARAAHRRPAGLRRSHLAAARPRPDERRRTARRDDRRRRGGGVRQGRAPARAALPGRTADRPGGGGGDPHAIRFPRGLTASKDLEKHRYDFSFSGLKTAVARYVEAGRGENSPSRMSRRVPRVRRRCADAKAIAACRDLGVPRLLLGGGVVANARVRELATERAAEAGVALRIPPLALCTDNGAMIAALGARLVAEGHAPSELGSAPTPPFPSRSCRPDRAGHLRRHR